MAGWVFEDWRGGKFYPEGLRQKDELHWASRQLTAIEINSTFYSTQKPKSFAGWAAQTPARFMFTLKGPQLVTHIKKLREVEGPLANFFASGVLALGPRLGPICWQLPGNLSFNPERIAAFLELLPQTPEAALALARRHDERIAEPFLEAAGVSRLRHAIEARHQSFADPTFIDMLRARNVALVVSDTAEWPYADQTADFAYCRLQGAPGADHYEPADLDAWAQRLEAWSEGKPAKGSRAIGDGTVPAGPRDVFAFFVSTDKANAPGNARALLKRLRLEPDSN